MNFHSTFRSVGVMVNIHWQSVTPTGEVRQKQSTKTKRPSTKARAAHGCILGVEGYCKFNSIVEDPLNITLLICVYYCLPYNIKWSNIIYTDIERIITQSIVEQKCSNFLARGVEVLCSKTYAALWRKAPAKCNRSNDGCMFLANYFPLGWWRTVKAKKTIHMLSPAHTHFVVFFPQTTLSTLHARMMMHMQQEKEPCLYEPFQLIYVFV